MNRNKSKKLTALITALSIVAVVGIVSSVYNMIRAKEYKSMINHSYSRSLTDLTDSVRDINYSLEKGLLITSPSQIVRLSNEINRNANSAMANLGQLPLSGIQMDNTEKFLSQVGDFTSALAVKVSSGKAITEEDFQSLQNLSDYCVKLSGNLEKIQKSFYDGKLSIQRLKNEAKNKNADFLDDKISATEEDFVDYPSLVYDGPFSSHIDTVEYSSLKNLPEISEKEARKVVENFIGSDKYIIKSAGEKGGKLPCYSFKVYSGKASSKNYLTFDITKQGGKVAWFLNNYNPKKTEITVSKAIENARNFLETHGYYSMEESYYDCRENVATINFAYKEGNITMYPDLIKVKIAMDSGMCIGMEAGGYLMNNKNRSDLAPVLTPSEASAEVSSKLAVDSMRLAVIPTEYMSEILCYEFKGHLNDKNFLIYVNAESGKQEQILVLLESENGILTI